MLQLFVRFLLRLLEKYMSKLQHSSNQMSHIKNLIIMQTIARVSNNIEK